jgi:PPP family 3-phenylpropionic acid transporter
MALGLFYACAYLPVGITLPYLPQHFRSLGLTGARVGMLMAAYPLMSLLVPPAFGFVADRTRRGASLLRLATLFAALSTVPLLFATGEAAIAPWLLLAAFCGAPVSMLADSLTLERLGARAREYPRVRLWGSVGFVVAAAGFGFLYTGERTSPPKVIVAALVGSGLAFLASLFLRGQGVREGKLSLSDAAALLRDRRVRLLFAVTCLHWLANSPYNLLFTVFLKDEGLAPSVAGLGMGVGVVAEVSVMFAFPRIARHLTARRRRCAGRSSQSRTRPCRWCFCSSSTA